MNLVAKRVNTYLEPRVIRHGWTPTIGGGMGHEGADNQWKLPGINPATNEVGLFNWMSDISTAATAPECALLQPMKRHNPLLYMRVETANDVNYWPNAGINPPPPGLGVGTATCQPRTGQNNQQQQIPAGMSTGGWLGGAFTGGYDVLEHPYYRPQDMMNTARLFQSQSDCIAYKQFPFIPRVEKNFSEVKFNSSNTDQVFDVNNPNQVIGEVGSSLPGIMNGGGASANEWQRLMKWETRDGDRILIRNNYHKFEIDVYPDLAVQVPVSYVQDNMPGMPLDYADGGQLDSPIYSNTINKGQTFSANTGAVTSTWEEIHQNVGYIHKKPKWFANIRFLVVKRQRKYKEQGGGQSFANQALKLIGVRQAQVGNLGQEPGKGDFLYTFKKYFQQDTIATQMIATDIQRRGEYLNVPAPGQAQQGLPVMYAYEPSYIFDKRDQAREVWKALYDRADTQHKSKISGVLNPQAPGEDMLMSNPKDVTLKIMYDKTLKLSGKKTHYTHIMNTMKNKVMDYLKEAQEQQNANPVETQDKFDQERTQNPLNTEYRFWVIVHAHNCRVQLKADHVFKFDA